MTELVRIPKVDNGKQKLASVTAIILRKRRKMLQKEIELIDKYIDNATYNSDEYKLLANIKEALITVESVTKSLNYFKHYNLTDNSNLKSRSCVTCKKHYSDDCKRCHNFSMFEEF